MTTFAFGFIAGMAFAAVSLGLIAAWAERYW